MKISIITLFPEMFPSVLDTSILGRAQKKGLLEIEYINLRNFGEGTHQTVDDRPFGGGVGMVLKPDILARAVKNARSGERVADSKSNTQSPYVILTSASGSTFTQETAKKLSKMNHLILIAGHYEGVDQRFIDHYVDEEISIGDYVLTGGELPAMVLIDTAVRLIPGVLEKEEAVQHESFENNLLEHPQYTRPAVFEESDVPEVLTSGNHAEIEKWRHEQSMKRTKERRPDLLSGK